MSILDDVLPSQKYDETPVSSAARALLQALTSQGAKEQPRVTVELGPDEWRALEAQFRRPFRPHSSSKLLPVEGVGWVEFRRETPERCPPLKCDHCDATVLAEEANLGPTSLTISKEQADALDEYAAARGWRMIGPPPATAAMPIASMDPNFRQQPALTPEADAAIAAARIERAAWTPEALVATVPVPKVDALPDADGGLWRGGK